MASVRVQVTHGQDKHDVYLDTACGELTVSDLAKELARITEVPVPSQKIICKGKSITDQFASLKSVGIKNNSKIMLLGKKVNLTEDKNMATMAKVESDITKVSERLGDLSKELEGIKNGFLPTDLVPEGLKKLGMNVGACSEEFTRALERLDALVLAEASPEVRQRRKTLVGKIQGMLDFCDRVRSDVREQQSRR